MLLRALTRYRGSDGVVPAGYARKTLGFVLRIDDDAEGCVLNSQYDPRPDARGKQQFVPLTALVPNVTRTVKPVPMLGCDNAGYVLARPKLVDDPVKQAKEDVAAQTKRELFDELLGEYAEANDDEDARTFLRWRRNGSPGAQRAVETLDDFSAKRLDLDPIAIQVGASMWLHLKPAAQRFWSARVGAAKSGGGQGVCLSCGEYKTVVHTLPQSLTGALVPATSTANVALLSANFPAASRGASGTGLKSAPVCTDCASGAVSSFNALASSERHRWGNRSEARATIWWATDDAIGFEALDQTKPEAVQGFLEALDTGRHAPGRLDLERFYALTFSGNVARLVVRQWIDLPLAEVHKHVVRWFHDSATPDVEYPYVGASEMARSCGSFVPSDGAFASMPEGSRELLLRCALTGGTPPKSLLIRAVSRARAEIHYLSLSDARQVAVVRRRMKARFALIRLTLNRLRPKESPVPQYLDEERNEPAYLYGRLFAERESLQRRALGEVNTSITDRYFDRASADPLSVERALTVLEKKHLESLRRKGEKGTEVAFDKRIGALHERIELEPPLRRMSVEEQALWIAGYYQQRQQNFRAAAESKSTKPETIMSIEEN